MAGGSAYRPPQFSEDMDWLPPWLQPHQLQSSAKEIDNTHTLSPLPCKDLAVLQENMSDGRDGYLFSRGDARYSSYHLFLSGEDQSPIGITPSENVLHFHLYLSSQGISQQPSSQFDVIGQPEKHESNRVLSPQHILGASVVRDVAGCQNKKDDKDCSVGLLPITCTPSMLQKTPSQSLAKDNRNSGKKLQEKFDGGHLKNADINDAVELSIAASEALAISELAKSDLPSEALPAATILEVALRVKQARNHCFMEGFEDISAFPTDEFDEIDQLSDLDESTMADAFEDVGLSVTQVVATPTPPTQKYHANSSSLVIKEGCVSCTDSLVQNTHFSESSYECNGEVEKKELKTRDVDLIGNSSPKKLNDAFVTELRSKVSPLKSIIPQQNEPCVDGSLNSNTLSLERNLKAHSHRLVQATANALLTSEVAFKECILVSKGGSFDLEGTSICHTQGSMVSSPRIQESGKTVEAENAVNDAAAEQFRSRWLGGWSGKNVDATGNSDESFLKNVDATGNSDENGTNSLQKFFVRETSFFSESVDVVADENLSLQKPEAGPSIVASSSIPFENLYRNVNEGIPLSQDVVTSSFSLVDPLCSVVPCSISSDDAPVLPAPNQKDLDEETGKFLNPSTEFVGLKSLHGNAMVSSAEVKFPSTSFAHGATSRKQLTSLKTYSMLASALYAVSEGEYVHNESMRLGETERIIRLIPSGKTPKTFTSSINEDLTGVLFPKSTSIYQGANEPSNTGISASKHYEKFHETSAIGKPIFESTAPKLNSTETTTDDTEVLIHKHGERRSPFILNYGTRRRLQAFKTIVGDKSEENLKQDSILHTRKTRLGIDQTKVTSVAPLHSSIPSHCPGNQSLACKRVRFSEAEVIFHHRNTRQKLPSGQQTCSRSRRGKRAKDSNLPKFGTGNESYKSLTNCCIKDIKRMMFQGLEFLLTGVSSRKERELEMLIRKHGGVVLSNIPSPSPNLRRKRRLGLKNQQHPIVLSPKKVQTTKFLYGCAVNTLLLSINWLNDSITACSVLPPEKYLILSHQAAGRRRLKIGKPVCSDNYMYIFERVGIMLYGKPRFCTKLAEIVKHGGGQVFKTLQWLVQSLKNGKNSVGAIVVEDDGRASRHLRHCALENRLHMMPASWIINSLHLGKLLPVEKNDQSASLRTIMILDPQAMEMSEEI